MYPNFPQNNPQNMMPGSQGNVTIPASTMEVTPAAVDQYFNVSREINANVWAGCCETVTVRNTSDQVIQMRNASIDISRPDLAVTR